MKKFLKILFILSITGIISGASLQGLFPREFLPEGEVFRETVPECVDGFCLYDFWEYVLSWSWFIFIATFLILFSKKILSFIGKLFRDNNEPVLVNQEVSNTIYNNKGNGRRGQLLMWLTITFFFSMIIGAFFAQWSVDYINPFGYVLRECLLNFWCNKSGIAGLVFSISFVGFLVSFVAYSLMFGIFPSLQQVSKKKITNFLTMLAVLGILLSIVFLNPLFFGICHSAYLGGNGVPEGCVDDTAIMLGLPFLWLSIGVLIVITMLRFVSEDVFSRWRKFANRYLFFGLLLVLFTPVDSSRGFIDLDPSKGTTSLIVSVFFVFWSGWLLFIRSRRKFNKEKVV